MACGAGWWVCSDDEIRALHVAKGDAKPHPQQVHQRACEFQVLHQQRAVKYDTSPLQDILTVDKGKKREEVKSILKNWDEHSDAQDTRLYAARASAWVPQP